METLDGGPETLPSFCTGSCSGTTLTDTCSETTSGVTITTTSTVTLTATGASGTVSEDFNGTMCSYTLTVTKN